MEVWTRWVLSHNVRLSLYHSLHLVARRLMPANCREPDHADHREFSCKYEQIVTDRDNDGMTDSWIHSEKWRHSNMWSHNDLYVVGQHGVLCEVKWCIFVAHYLWSPYVIGRPYIFSSCFFFFLLSSFFFLFFPRLISAVVDWMFTILWHMVWP